MSVRLSIVIVSYNTRGLLGECLASIDAAPPESAFEVIVVDNGSADGSVEMVRRDHPAARLVVNEVNRRWAGGNNQGAACAGGDYLLFLNSDTVVTPGALEAFVRFMDNRPEAAIAGCRLLNPDLTLQPSCRGFPDIPGLFSEALFLNHLFPRSWVFGRYTMSAFAHDTVREVDMVTGAAIAVRRAVFDRVGPFDEAFHFYGEETDYCRRAREAGFRTWFFPEGVIIHRGGGSPQPRESYHRNLYEGLRRYLVKHHRGARLAALIALQWLGAAVRVPVYFAQGMLTGNVALFRKSLYYLKLLV